MSVFNRITPTPLASLVESQLKVKKTARGTGKDKLKIKERATAPLSRKLHLMTLMDESASKEEGDTQLNNAYNTERRVEELRTRLVEYDMFTPCFSEFRKITTTGGGDRGRGQGNTESKYTSKGQYRPPDGGEKERKIHGKTHYPCRKCGWNMDHSTSDNSQKRAAAAARKLAFGAEQIGRWRCPQRKSGPKPTT
uniref:Uncharacterized protein n=1 Tax=Odontella aurita TaxID=265563 RepID=A0A7S4JYG4_9STRA|mmetsp:Transcript_5727/g.16510  ORF Transcript_5727/g.16510 Transcript_5727/m.16510 type:complete len:195 (+) Transcript_5727:470-1054(+)